MQPLDREVSGPSVDERFSDARTGPLGLADDFHADMAAVGAAIDSRRNAEANLEQERLDEQFRVINEFDSTHCRQCGRVTAGTVLAGAHVQLCDPCLVRNVREQVGDREVRSA